MHSREERVGGWGWDEPCASVTRCPPWDGELQEFITHVFSVDPCWYLHLVGIPAVLLNSALSPQRINLSFSRVFWGPFLGLFATILHVYSSWRASSGSFYFPLKSGFWMGEWKTSVTRVWVFMTARPLCLLPHCKPQRLEEKVIPSDCRVEHLLCAQPKAGPLWEQWKGRVY